VVKISHVHKYFGRLHVLDDVTLEVARGEVALGYLHGGQVQLNPPRTAALQLADADRVNRCNRYGHCNSKCVADGNCN